MPPPDRRQHGGRDPGRGAQPSDVLVEQVAGLGGEDGRPVAGSGEPCDDPVQQRVPQSHRAAGERVLQLGKAAPDATRRRRRHLARIGRDAGPLRHTGRLRDLRQAGRPGEPLGDQLADPARAAGGEVRRSCCPRPLVHGEREIEAHGRDAVREVAPHPGGDGGPAPGQQLRRRALLVRRDAPVTPAERQQRGGALPCGVVRRRQLGEGVQAAEVAGAPAAGDGPGETAGPAVRDGVAEVEGGRVRGVVLGGRPDGGRRADHALRGAFRVGGVGDERQPGRGRDRQRVRHDRDPACDRLHVVGDEDDPPVTPPQHARDGVHQPGEQRVRVARPGAGEPLGEGLRVERGARRQLLQRVEDGPGRGQRRPVRGLPQLGGPQPFQLLGLGHHRVREEVAVAARVVAAEVAAAQQQGPAVHLVVQQRDGEQVQLGVARRQRRVRRRAVRQVRRDRGPRPVRQAGRLGDELEPGPAGGPAPGGGVVQLPGHRYAPSGRTPSSIPNRYSNHSSGSSARYGRTPPAPTRPSSGTPPSADRPNSAWSAYCCPR